MSDIKAIKATQLKKHANRIWLTIVITPDEPVMPHSRGDNEHNDIDSDADRFPPLLTINSIVGSPQSRFRRQRRSICNTLGGTIGVVVTTNRRL
jgi:hypothetical protein